MKRISFLTNKQCQLNLKKYNKLINR